MPEKSAPRGLGLISWHNQQQNWPL